MDEKSDTKQLRMQEIQRELIENVIPGGMMGGYIEEGFPFYYINQRMLSYLGYEDEASFVADIDGKITNCMHPDDRERVDAECDRQIAATGSYDLEYRMRKQDGSYIWVHDYGRKYTDEGRDVIVSVCYDITGEKERERTLMARINMEQKRLLGGDGKLLAYIISDVTKKEVKENRAFFGETPMLARGVDLDYATQLGAVGIVDQDKRKAMIHMHEKEYLEDLYARGVSSTSLEYRRRKPDGTISWEKNVLNVLWEPESGDLFLYEYCYDINKERLLEEVMLAAVNYDYERIGSINIEADQISILDPVPDTEDYELKIRKYSDLCRQYAKQFVLEDDQETFLGNVLPEYLAEHLEATGSFDFIHRERDADGKIRYKQDRHAYYDKRKRICLITRSDITEMVQKEEQKQKKLKEALEKERQAAQAKSDFLSRMSHEMRTPLNAIAGYSTLLEASARSDERDRTADIEQLRAIQAAARYQLAIIGDILDRQKIEHGQIELKKVSVDVDDYMKNIVDMIRNEAEKKQIDFQYERLTQISDHYYMDGVRLQQVILNLLHNAMKFTPAGGSVRMTTEAVRVDGGGTLLKFVISDTGIGMSKKFMEEKLYQAFSQENQGMKSPYEGTGIGLSISSELIQLMGGRIVCESEKGKGTTFTVMVPADVSADVEQPHRRERQKRSYDLGGVRILVCEDNPMNQDMTRSLLTKMNCRVDVADDGKIGAEKFRDSEAGYYDLVLMDLRMPVMDGFEATREIRAMERADAKQVPILALSANAFEEDVRQSLESGMNEHMAKPVDAQVLYQKIGEYTHKKS